MKGFKHTGRGPKYGEHTFHAKHGFTGSTGKVRNVRSYAQAVPQMPEAAPPDMAPPQGPPMPMPGPPMPGSPPPDMGPPQGLKRGGAVNSCGGKMGKAKGGWIQGAIKHPGALHKALGVPQGTKIPAKKLAKAEHSSDPLMRKRAQLAENLKGLHKASGGAVNSCGGKSSGTKKSGGMGHFSSMPMIKK